MIRIAPDTPTSAAVSPDREAAASAVTSAAHAVPVAPGVAVYESHDSSFSDSMVANSPYAASASTFARGDLLPYAVRMVEPIRCEFGRALDVNQLLYDADCAKEIIRLALTSKNARLRGYAMFMDIKMFGAPVPALTRATGNAARRQHAAVVQATPHPREVTSSLRRGAHAIDLVV